MIQQFNFLWGGGGLGWGAQAPSGLSGSAAHLVVLYSVLLLFDLGLDLINCAHVNIEEL